MNIHDSLDFRAKYQHFVKTLIVLLAIVVSVFIKIYVDQRNDLDRLQKQLANKDILLIPSSVDGHTSKLNEVSDKDIRAEALFITNLMGNISKETVELNYLTISEKMPERIKVKFLKDAALKINYIQDNDIAEIIKSHSINALQTGSYSYRVTVQLELTIIIDELKSGVKSEILEFDLEVLSPTKAKRWVLSITTFKRLTVDQYEKLKGVR